MSPRAAHTLALDTLPDELLSRVLALVAERQAERDVARYTELVSKQTGTQVALDNARTSAASARAAILGDQAQIENLNVQLSWYTIKAPIAGRVSGTILTAVADLAEAGHRPPKPTKWGRAAQRLTGGADQSCPRGGSVVKRWQTSPASRVSV
mgnify:CR=1 FL=1